MANQNGSTEHELNYVTSNRFYVEMESEIKASFSDCQGLGVTLDHSPYLEGGLNNQQRIFVGQAKFSDVTLKRGVTSDLAFLEWVNQVLVQLIDGRSPGDKPTKTRRNINILVFNQAGETMQCWTLIGAVPVGWKAPALQANATSAAIEELVLAYEGIKVFQRSGSKGVTVHSGRDSTSRSYASN